MPVTEPKSESWVVGAVLAGVNFGLGVFMAWASTSTTWVTPGWQMAYLAVALISCTVAGTTGMYALLKAKGRLR